MSRVEDGCEVPGNAPNGMRAMLLSAECEEALLHRWLELRDPKAARALVESHLPLLLSIASRYRRLGVPMGDLVSEGTLGLYDALERYERKGARFSTYASYWVKARICTFIEKMRSPLGTSAGPGAVADESQALLEGMEADGACPETLSARAQVREWVRRAVAKTWKNLDERERAVLMRRLLDDGETLRDVGSQLGLSGERVRQIETQLKKRLRREVSAELGQWAA